MSIPSWLRRASVAAALCVAMLGLFAAPASAAPAGEAAKTVPVCVPQAGDARPYIAHAVKKGSKEYQGYVWQRSHPDTRLAWTDGEPKPPKINGLDGSIRSQRDCPKGRDYRPTFSVHLECVNLYWVHATVAIHNPSRMNIMRVWRKDFVAYDSQRSPYVYVWIYGPYGDNTYPLSQTYADVWVLNGPAALDIGATAHWPNGKTSRRGLRLPIAGTCANLD